jgi:transmembrane sensor
LKERALRELTRSEVDRPTARRLWIGVQDRRNRTRARRRATFAIAAGVALAIAIVGASIEVRRGERAMAVRESSGALRLRGGIPWHQDEQAISEVRSLEFVDGSRIVLDPGASIEPLENTDRSAVLLLGHGRARFEVEPGGPRRWSIETGLATIEVVGTRFTVTRTLSGVTVEVEHGVVLVRGERLPSRVRRLTAGESLHIEPDPMRPDAPASPPASASAAASTKVEGPTLPWHSLAEQGDFAGAYNRLGTDGIAERAKTADVEQLLALADVARFSGHPADAIAPLRRVMSEHADDARGALAAFTLGRLELDQLQNPAAAAKAFEAAIALRLPEALLEDAYLRLIDAKARAGDRHGAHDAWVTYHERFPNSTRRIDADQWRRGP